MCQYSIIGGLILLLGHISASLASYEDFGSLEVPDASSSASASYEAEEYEDYYDKALPVYRRSAQYSGENGLPFVLPQVDDTVAYWESIYGTDDVPEFDVPPIIEGETIFMDLDDLVEDEDPETIQVKREASSPIEYGEDSEGSPPSGDADYQTRMAITNRSEFYDATSPEYSQSSTALNTDKDEQVYGSTGSTSAVISSSFDRNEKSTQRSELSSAVGMRGLLDIDSEMESALESPETVRAPLEARSIKSSGQIEALGNSKRKIIQAKKDLVSLAASGASEAEIAEAAQKTFEAKQDLVDSVILSTVSAVQSKKALVDSLATDVHQRKFCSTKARSQSRSGNSCQSISNCKRKIVEAKKDFIQTALGGGSQVELNDALIETLEAKKDLLDSIISPRTEDADSDEQGLGSATTDFGLSSLLTENYQGNSQITSSNIESQGSLQYILDLKLKILQAKGDLIRTVAEGGSQEEINDAVIKTLEAKKDLLNSVLSIGENAADNGITVSTVLDIGLDSLLNEDDQVINLVADNLQSRISLQTVLELKRKLIEAKGNLIRVATARGGKSELIDALVKTLAAKKDLLNSIIPAGWVNLNNDADSASRSIDLGLDTILNSDQQRNGQISADLQSILDSKKKLIQAKVDLIKTALAGGNQSELNNAFLEILEAKRDLLDSVVATGVQSVDNGETVSAVLDIGLDSLLNEDDQVISQVTADLRSRVSLQTVSQLKQKLIEVKGNLLRTVTARGCKSKLIDALVKTLAAKKDLLNSIIPVGLVNLNNDGDSASSSIDLGLDTILNNGQVSTNLQSILDSKRKLIQAKSKLIETVDSVLSSPSKTVGNETDSNSDAIDFSLGSSSNGDNQEASQIAVNLRSQSSRQSNSYSKRNRIEAKKNSSCKTACENSGAELSEAVTRTLDAKKELLDTMRSTGTCRAATKSSNSVKESRKSVLNSKRKIIQAKGDLIRTVAEGGSETEITDALMKTLEAKKDLVDSVISPQTENINNGEESRSETMDFGLGSILTGNHQANSQIPTNVESQDTLQSVLDSKLKVIQAKGDLIRTVAEGGSEEEINDAVIKTLEAKKDLLESVVSIGAQAVDNGETVSTVLDIGLDSLLNDDHDQVISQITANPQSSVLLQTVLELKRKLIEAKENLVRIAAARGSKSELIDAVIKTLAAKKDLLNSIRSAGSVNLDNNKESASSSIDVELDTISSSDYQQNSQILADLQSILESKKKLIHAKGNLLETALAGGNQTELNDAFLETLEAKKDLIDSVISPPSKTANDENESISDAIDLGLDSFLNGNDEAAAPIGINLRSQSSSQSNLDSKRKRIEVKKNSSCKIACENSRAELSAAVTRTLGAKKELFDAMRSTGTCRATKKYSNSVRESTMDSSMNESIKNDGNIVRTSCQRNQATRQSVSSSKRKIIQAKKDLIQKTVAGGSEAELSEALRKTLDAKKELLDSVTSTNVETTNNVRDSCHADTLQSLINLKRKLMNTKKGLLESVTSGGVAANVNDVVNNALNAKKGIIDSIISQDGEISSGDLISGLTIQSEADASSALGNLNLFGKLNSQTEVTGETTTIQNEESSVQSTSTGSSSIAVEGEIGTSVSSNSINRDNDISLNVNKEIIIDDQDVGDLQGSPTTGYDEDNSSASTGSLELPGELSGEVEVAGGTTKIQNEKSSVYSTSNHYDNIAVDREIGISSSTNTINRGKDITLNVNKNIQTEAQTSSDFQESPTISYSENDSSTSSGSYEVSGELDDKLGVTSGTKKIQNHGSSLQSTLTGASSVTVASSSNSVESSSQISLTVNKKIQTNAQISSNLQTNSVTKQSGGSSEALVEEAANVVVQDSLENASSSSEENSGKEVSEPTNVEIASSSELLGSLNIESQSTTDTVTSNSGIQTSVELESSLEAKVGDGLQLIDSDCALGQCGISGKLHVNLNAGGAINVESEILPAVCLAEPTLSLNLQDEDQISQNTEIELQGDVEQQELIQEGNNEDVDEDIEPMPESNEQLLTASDNDNQPNIGRTYYGENTQYSTGGGIFSNAHHRLINLDVNCTGKTAFMNPECQQLNANLGHPRDSSMSITLRTVKTYLSHGQELAQEMQNRAKWLCDEGFIPKLHTPAMLHLINSLATENTVEISQKSEFSLFGTKLLQRRLSSDFHVTPNTFLEFLQHHAFRVIGTGLCYVRPKRCPANQMYRTFDGSCNNQEHPTWGQTNTAFTRVLPPRYSDGVHELPKSVTGEDLPNPRLLSAQCFSRNGVSDRRLTLAVAQWGQLLAHDTAMQTTDQTVKGGIQCCADGKQLPKNLQHHSCLPIEIPKNDEFYSRFGSECMEFVRSMTVSREDCSLGPAEQINAVSSYLDASQLYGSDKETADRLRAFEGGRMKVSIRRGRELPPVMTNRSRYCDVMSPSEVCYQAGDVRVNQVPHLTVLQICLLREHNRIADELQRLNPHWEDEHVFQETRKIVIAEYQHITYSEWLPAVIGKKYCQRYGLTPRNQGGMSRAYDPRVKATTINGFTTAAYRSFHSMLDGHIHLCPASREISHTLRLSNHYFRPQVIERNDNLDDLIRGLVTQPMQKSDINFDPEITEYLFRSRSEFGLDLKSLDIQRGRDHGIPGYNRYREICGLTYATDFDDLRREIPLENINKLKKVYAHVDDIDLIVGAVMERKPPGSILGPIVRCLLGEQFYRSRIGDRYFYDNADQPHSFTPEQFEEIKKASLARLLCDTGDNIEEIQPEPFRLISCNNPLTSCSALPKLDLSPWQETECS